MSSMYYIGTLEKDENEIFHINEPIYTPGISMDFVKDLLEESGIALYNDFTCASSESLEPTLYSIDSDWTGPLNDKYKECYMREIPFFEIEKSSYPLVCDCKERNGLKIGVIEDEVHYTNPKNFNKINTDMNNIKRILSANDYYKNNYEDLVFEDVIKTYNVIASWIESNENIYVYLDY